jgi:O-methyltransferase involved in polyketide biosynthesis
LSGSDSISPTAHYTGYVWARNGLSHPELETTEGRVLFESIRPLMIGNSLIGGGTLEGYLLARHRAIDALLEHAIDEHQITQVIEVAAGLSPRGWRFTQRHGPGLTYIEADLEGMTERKRRALERIGSLDEWHRVVEVDALLDEGPQSLLAVADGLDAAKGLAIITEGLLGYLPRDDVLGIWRRFAHVLSGFSRGRYISDIHLGSVQNVQARAFRVLLSAFVRGRVHMHFDDANEVVEQLHEAGFVDAQVRRSIDVTATDGRNAASEMSHILEASTK